MARLLYCLKLLALSAALDTVSHLCMTVLYFQGLSCSCLQVKIFLPQSEPHSDQEEMKPPNRSDRRKLKKFLLNSVGLDLIRVNWRSYLNNTTNKAKHWQKKK